MFQQQEQAFLVKIALSPDGEGEGRKENINQSGAGWAPAGN